GALPLLRSHPAEASRIASASPDRPPLRPPIQSARHHWIGRQSPSWPSRESAVHSFRSSQKRFQFFQQFWVLGGRHADRIQAAFKVDADRARRPPVLSGDLLVAQAVDKEVAQDVGVFGLETLLTLAQERAEFPLIKHTERRSIGRRLTTALFRVQSAFKAL